MWLRVVISGWYGSDPRTEGTGDRNLRRWSLDTVITTLNLRNIGLVSVSITSKKHVVRTEETGIILWFYNLCLAVTITLQFLPFIIILCQERPFHRESNAMFVTFLLLGLSLAWLPVMITRSLCSILRRRRHPAGTEERRGREGAYWQ